MTWLLTGGAGYIGAHIVRSFRTADHDVVVVDDLSTGHRDTVPDDVPLVEVSVLDTAALAAAMRDHGVTGVVHLAAKKAVSESVERPLFYYRQNVEGTRSVLAAMRSAQVDRIVFSSSAAVYGMPDLDVVGEDAPTEPLSPYGETKLVGEWMIRDASGAHGLRSTSLRYFNVAGSGAPDLGDRGVFNLIPMVFERLERDEPARIFGDDYPTRDGTCVRDYIHVADLADAHVAAAAALERGDDVRPVFNVSRGVGSTVREVVEVARAVTGIDLDPVVTDRRPGDPARVVGSADAIAADLGWTARHDLHDMVASAWEAWRHHA